MRYIINAYSLSKYDAKHGCFTHSLKGRRIEYRYMYQKIKSNPKLTIYALFLELLLSKLKLFKGRFYGLFVMHLETLINTRCYPTQAWDVINTLQTQALNDIFFL